MWATRSSLLAGLVLLTALCLATLVPAASASESSASTTSMSAASSESPRRGSAIGVEPDTIDFGFQDTIGNTVEYFEVSNTGAPGSVLEIVSVTIDGFGYEFWTYPPRTPFTLEADGESVKRIGIRLQTDEFEGELEATVRIASVDQVAEVTLTAFVDGPPTCVLIAPATARLREEITFDASASSDRYGTVERWLWKFHDYWIFDGEPIVTRSFDEPGTYTATVEVTDNLGGSSDCSRELIITGPTCDPGGPYASVPLHPVSFDGSGSSSEPGIVEYAWDFGGGSTASGARVTHTYTRNGNYTVTLCVTDGNGELNCCSAPVPITGPECDTGGPYSTVAGQQLVLDGSDSGGPSPIETAEWTFGDGTSATGLTVVHIYESPGPYAPELCVTDELGNQACCQTSIFVQSLEPPRCDAGGPVVGERFETFTFDGSASTDPDGEIVQYRWEFGDGGVGEGAVVTHVYNGFGTMLVTLCVVDNDGGMSCCTTFASTSPYDTNALTTLVLHVEEPVFATECDLEDPCIPYPNTTITEGQANIYLLARNYDHLTAVTTTLDLDHFIYVLGFWACLPGQVTNETLTTADGESQLTLSTSFDTIAGGDSAILGVMWVIAGGAHDCVRLIGSYGEDATIITSAFGLERQLDANNLGTVCVDVAGFDACEPRVAVEATTWGQIKARYR